MRYPPRAFHSKVLKVIDNDLLINHHHQQQQQQQNVRNLLTHFEKTITKAKIAAFEQPPIGLVLTSQNEERCIIPIRNSFATVRELELRRMRMHSLIDNCGFLLVDKPQTMGMPSLEVLERFKAGLREALYVTECLSDLETHPSLLKYQTGEVADEINPHGAYLGFGAHIAQTERQFQQIKALRDLQAAHLRKLPSRDLAWLLTLGQGAVKGYERYSWESLKNDRFMLFERMTAFTELTFCGGLFFLWAYVRGTGSLGSFACKAINGVANEVKLFEQNAYFGGQEKPVGLHRTIMKELRERLVKIRRARAAEDGLDFNEEDVDSIEVWKETHDFIGREIGWKGWKSYHAVVSPSPPEQ